MASKSIQLVGVLFLLVSIFACSSRAQLSTSFYSSTCPNLQTIVRNTMKQAVHKEQRMGASILRLFFHDCFVNGCDASVLLDDTTTFTGEKTSFANRNSTRGFDVIDTIKSNVEASCKDTVSCADILALASRDGVVLLGGPSWAVPLGRRDATTASLSTANSNLPGPGSSLSTLISLFSRQNLTANEMTALSGAHTIGQARCVNFRSHIYTDTDIDANFAKTRQANCPNTTNGVGDNNLAPLDISSPSKFDNGYYKDLVAKRGLFHSDQELFNGGSQDSLVKNYNNNNAAFLKDFVAAMIKMGSISPLTGSNGEIRKNCRVIN